MSPKIKCHQKSNITKNEISPNMKCHQNEMSPKIKCHLKLNVTKNQISPTILTIFKNLNKKSEEKA